MNRRTQRLTLSAILVAVMVVPAYRAAQKEVPGGMLGRLGSAPVQALIILAYLLMAVGSVI